MSFSQQLNKLHDEGHISQRLNRIPYNKALTETELTIQSRTHPQHGRP